MYDLFTGSISVLPTVLYLITGVLREMSSKSAERKSPVVVNSCLCTLKLLCTSQFLSDDSVSVRWSQSLQSALKTVLNSAKQSEYLMLIVHKKLNIFFHSIYYLHLFLKVVLNKSFFILYILSRINFIILSKPWGKGN
jgi:hypothetical protein